MNITTERVLDALATEEPCLGAFFSTFTFDPAFFEDHVLRAVLRLASDPVEQSDRYHQECRRALQEVPVAVVVDAGERGVGRRMPYDLLEVSSVVFHPKTVLLLFGQHARLLVGSGNLTSHGYGGNTELFFRADLRYDSAADASVLASFDAHLKRITPLLRAEGTQLALVRNQLRRALGRPATPRVPPSFRLLDSTAGPILEQALALLPRGAELTSIGLAAPFYERDDGGELDASSVFGALLQHAAADVSLDVAVAWENVRVQSTDPIPLASGFGRLWTWEYEEEGERRQDHLVPVKMGPQQLTYRDSQGRSQRWPKEDAESALEARRLWPQPDPVAYVPRQLLESAEQAAAELRLWLHPSTRLVDGRPQCRPLHAKLLVLAYRGKAGSGTLVVMGSPNMSRRALLLKAGEGNVEVAVAFRIRDALRLPDLMSGIVQAPREIVSLREREFPAAGTNYALAVERAVHDPQASTLVVHWAPEAASLPPWRLSYQSRQLAASREPPSHAIELPDFVLQPGSAELALHVDGETFAVPILVSDLVHLPADATAPPLSLDELLLLASGRIGSERALHIARSRGTRTKDGGSDDELATFFRERFTPTDVFRAWWCAVRDLNEASLSLAGFRLKLEGATGTAAVWNAIRRSVGQQYLQAEEAWLFGAELLRSLGDVDVSAGAAADADAKSQVLNAFRTRVRAELQSMLPPGAADPVLRHVRAFYQESMG